jgi:hypothetical protein
MKVVRHEGLGVQDQITLPAQGGESLDKVVPVGIILEDLRALDAPANDVVQGPGGIQPRLSRHARMVCRPCVDVNAL